MSKKKDFQSNRKQKQNNAVCKSLAPSHRFFLPIIPAFLIQITLGVSKLSIATVCRLFVMVAWVYRALQDTQT